MNSNLKTGLKFLVYIFFPIIIFFIKSESNLPIGWVAWVFLILGYQFMLKDEFLSNEKKYLIYLKNFIQISDEEILKNAITFVFKKDYNKLKNIFENNISNISLKYLFLQQQIQVNKIYDYIDELLEIQNGNEKFGDIQYLILLCYKYNNDLLKYEEIKSKLKKNKTFLFKNQVSHL